MLGDELMILVHIFFLAYIFSFGSKSRATTAHAMN
jgi:hypothetical protein